jgi:hypothetical protein
LKLLVGFHRETSEPDVRNYGVLELERQRTFIRLNSICIQFSDAVVVVANIINNNNNNNNNRNNNV